VRISLPDAIILGTAITAMILTVLLRWFIDPAQLRTADVVVLRNLSFHTTILGRYLTPQGRRLWVLRNFIALLMAISVALVSQIPYSP